MKTVFFTNNKINTNLFCVFLLAVCILLCRRYDAFVNPQLWAEDGTLFLQQYYEKGFGSLITPYAGYLNTAQRLIVLFWGRLDINLLYLPAAYNVTVLLLYCWLTTHLWKSAEVLQLRHRMLYALMFIIIPITSDVFMNITNLNGIISLVLINLLVTRRVPAGFGWYIGFLLLLLVISLSGPTSIILCPVIALLFLVERKRLTAKTAIALGLIFICGVFQLYLVKFVDTNFHRGVDGAHESYHLIRFFTNNVADLFWLSDGSLSVIPHPVQIGICLLLLVLMAAFFIKQYVTCQFNAKHFLLLTALLYTASTLVSYWPTESQLLALRNASRYFLVPYVCLAWLLLLSLDKKINNVHLLLYAVFILLHARLIRFSLPDKHWKWEIMEYREGKREVIDINPDGWVLRLPPKKK